MNDYIKQKAREQRDPEYFEEPKKQNFMDQNLQPQRDINPQLPISPLNRANPHH